MSSRKPGYIIGIVTLAVLCCMPQVLGGLYFGWLLYPRIRTGRPISIFGPPFVYHRLELASLWEGRFAYLATKRKGDIGDCTIQLTDPETGENSKLDLRISPNSFNSFVPFVAGNRIWVLGRNGSSEVVDGALQDSKLVAPPGTNYDGRSFLWKGDPAVIESSVAGFTVSTFQNGAWTAVGHVDVPDFGRERVVGDIPVRFMMGSLFSGTSQIQVLNSDDGLHIFLHHEGRLFHHRGLDLNVEPLPKATVTASSNSNGHMVFTLNIDPDYPVSALKASNMDSDLAGWTLIGDTPVIGNQAQVCAFGLVIAGRPAALIVENAMSGNAIGHVYRLDGTTWNRIDSLSFPFGLYRFRAVTTADGQRSYVITTTATRVCRVYAFESTGIRQTGYVDQNVDTWLNVLFGVGLLFFELLALAIVQGVGTGLLMGKFTTSDYEFGTQTVKLASLGWRGIARLIDLGVMAFTTVGLGWLMTRGFDWQSLGEALNMDVPHSTIHIARRVAAMMAVWLMIVIFATLMAQASWGVTPGKWLCRLRTVRTSLRPCGFARSLARELVFFVDCGNFFCWTPGIVSIAYTDRRQRLGDLVADSIVIESRSFDPTT